MARCARPCAVSSSSCCRCSRSWPARTMQGMPLQMLAELTHTELLLDHCHSQLTPSPPRHATQHKEKERGVVFFSEKPQ